MTLTFLFDDYRLFKNFMTKTSKILFDLNHDSDAEYGKILKCVSIEANVYLDALRR